MPGGKPKVPEYPRPVSPVIAEEYPICDDTIIYDEGDDYYEDSAERRAAKRRRIESYAAAYLRGQPLFILSAQLKGPFNKGWENPWRRKRRIVKSTANGMPQLEVPETTIKPQPQIASSAAHAREVSSEILTPVYHTKQTSKQNLPGNKKRTSSSLLPMKQTTPASAADIGTPESKIRQVEDWLRKNENSSQTGQSLSQSSPSLLTRPSKNRSKKWESPVLEVEFPPIPDDILGHVLHPRSLAPDMGVHSVTTKRPEAPPHPAKSITPGDSATIEDDRIKDAQHSKAPSLSPTARHRRIISSTNKSRAEDAILAMKRRSLHTIPPSSHLPAFEYRRAVTKEPIQDAGLEHPQQPFDLKTTEVNALVNGDVRTDSKSNEPSDSLHTAIERASPGLIENAAVSPLEAESGPSANRDIPSAQMPIQIALESAPSNLSGPGGLLEEPRQNINSKTDQDTEGRIIGTVANVPRGNAPSESLDVPEPGTESGIVHIDQFQQPAVLPSEKTPKPAHMQPSDTQQMIESITPLAFSTIKKPNKTTGIQNNSTPLTATKVRRAAKGKRASFAPEEASSGSSRGSLKAIMKVAKSPRMDRAHPDRLKMTWEGEDDDENSVHSIHHVPDTMSNIPLAERGTKNGTPRGILRSSSNPSGRGLTSGTHKTSSSSFKQDAQRVRALDMIEDDTELPVDDFDVDAVMDDLGSYLGTWDPEKEALALGKTSG